MPNFLRSVRAPEPVPPSAQLAAGAVCVVPSLSVEYPEPPYVWFNGRRERDRRTSVVRGVQPQVYVRLSVFEH